MGIWLSLNSNKRNSDELVVFNGATETGFMVVQGGDWGMVDNTAIWSGSIDTEGSTKVGEKLENRTITLPFVIIGESTTDSINTRWAELADKIAEIREYKGTIRFRPSHATYGVNFEIEHIRLEGSYWGKSNELGGYRQVQIVATCRPYALMDPMNLSDDFSTDTFSTAGKYNNGGADWTADAGALTNMTAGSGLVTAANVNTENTYIHTGAAHEYGDVETSVWFNEIGSYVSGSKYGIIIKRIDASNYLEASITWLGVGVTFMKLDKVVAGVRTNLVNTSFSGSLDVNFAIVGRIENNVVHFEYWSTYPHPTTSASQSITPHVLSAADALLFGKDIQGRTGITFLPKTLTSKAYLFSTKAYTYKGIAGYPDEIKLCGEIPGNTNALVDVSYVPRSADNTYMLMSWNDRPVPHNFVPQNVGSDAWSVAGVTGVISAATSITTTASSYSGAEAWSVVCPATTDTGVAITMNRRFKKGITYTARCYVKSTDSTLARIKLGVSGDIATGTSVALTSGYVLYEVSWTPSSDAYGAYCAFGIAAATATTFVIDQVEVFEGTTLAYEDDYSYKPFDDFYHAKFPSFGIIDAGGTTASTTNEAIGAKYYTYTGSGTSKTFRIATNLVGSNRDDGETKLIAVWARVWIPSTATGVRFTAKAYGGYASNFIYTLEYGSSGKSVTTPSGSGFRLVYLGALPVQSYGGDMTLYIEATYGVTAVGLDCLVLADSDKFASNMSGVTQASVNPFNYAASELMTTVKSDLSAYTNTVTAYSGTPVLPVSKAYAAPGLIGSQIRMRGNQDLIIFPTKNVIDRTDAATMDEYVNMNGYLHCSVQPRLLMVGE